MLDVELPSGLDPMYLAHMKKVDPSQSEYYSNLGAGQFMEASVRAHTVAGHGVPTHVHTRHATPALAISAASDDPAAAAAAAAATPPTAIGATLNDIFNGEGLPLAVVSPAHHHIRGESEASATRETLDHELGLGKAEAATAALKHKAEWQQRLAQQDAVRAARRQVAQFHEARRGVSVGEIIRGAGSRAEAHRQAARVSTRGQRAQELKAGTAAKQYAAKTQSFLEQQRLASQANTHTALHSAASSGDVTTLMSLLHAKNLNLSGEYGQTPLILAAAEGQEDALKLLLEMGADADRADDDGMTALMWACGARAVGCVGALLDAGALVTPLDQSGNSASAWAASPSVLAGDVLARRQAMRTQNKRRWGKAGRASAMIEETGANWKTAWAQPSGEGWSLTTWYAPVKPRAAISKIDGRLKSADFSLFRKALPDYARYPGIGFPVTATTGETGSMLGQHLLPHVTGRNWDRLDHLDAPSAELQDAKRVEAVMRGEHAEAVLHDLEWHDTVSALRTGGAAAAEAVAAVLTHCVAVLGYAATKGSTSATERAAAVSLRERTRHLVRTFGPGAQSEAACHIIASLAERDERLFAIDGDARQLPRGKDTFGLDADPRQRRALPAQLTDSAAAAATAAMTGGGEAATARPRSSVRERQGPDGVLEAGYSREAEERAAEEAATAVDDDTTAGALLAGPAGAPSHVNAATAGLTELRPSPKPARQQQQQQQLTIRIVARILVAANHIPGRQACIDGSPNADGEAEAKHVRVFVSSRSLRQRTILTLLPRVVPCARACVVMA
jgi:hypothetical protein